VPGNVQNENLTAREGCGKCEGMDIQAMHRRGTSISDITRRTEGCRKTIRKYLKEPQKLPGYTKRAKRKSKLDPYKNYLLLKE
jgi:transposase